MLKCHLSNMAANDDVTVDSRSKNAAQSYLRSRHDSAALRYIDTFRVCKDEVHADHQYTFNCLRSVSVVSCHDALAQCWYNARPPSATVSQHYTNIGPASRVCRTVSYQLCLQTADICQ